MGGAKASGIGSRHGRGGIRKYMTAAGHRRHAAPGAQREPHMYPYKRRTSRLLAGVFKFLYGRGKRD